MPNYLRPHGLQCARIPCPSPSPGVCSNSCPLSWWCRLTNYFSVVPFSICLQSFPASGSFPVSWLFASGGQSVGASGSASVFPKNIQDLIYDYYQYFKNDWEVWPPCCPRDSQESSLAPQFESINSSVLSLLYGLVLTSVHDYRKNLTYGVSNLSLHIACYI